MENDFKLMEKFSSVPSPAVMIVDDDHNLLLVIEAILQKEGYRVFPFSEPLKALEFLRESSKRGNLPSLILSDLLMPGLSGMDLLREVSQMSSSGTSGAVSPVPVILLTAHGSIGLAVQALKLGAVDFISKPFEQSELIESVRKGISVSPPSYRSETGRLACLQSEKGKQVYSVLEKVAASRSMALLSGETGTGKEVLAREIHRLSENRKGPFIKVNCAAIPAPLIEAELFGYEQGAFTGAVQSKPGKFELAANGTLFLDEVAEMPEAMQVKLLHVLQDQEYSRIGGVQSHRVTARVLASTNKDLGVEVTAKRFRGDLYYRLNVIPIEVPPLRERKEEIDFLVSEYIQKFNLKLKKSVKGLDVKTREFFEIYPWPGNIRELENTLERMILLCDGDLLHPKDLPEEIRVHGMTASSDEGIGGQNRFFSFKAQVKQKTQTIEREFIERALISNDSNVTRAANQLGLSRKGLQLKMRELGLKRPFDQSS